MSNEATKNITVQIPLDLLEKLDAEAARLDLNRSQYFRRLVRQNLHPSPANQQVSHVEQPQTEAKAA